MWKLISALIGESVHLSFFLVSYVRVSICDFALLAFCSELQQKEIGK